MTDALIGHSGFVGGTLLRQRGFDALYRSSNIDSITGGGFDLVVCAGAPAQKWIANREPASDRASIEGLIARLSTIRCSTFVLISTVDVFKNAVMVDESSEVNEVGLHAYGTNRRLLEKFVERRFERHLVVRLPGLVGPGLRKNVIYDFLNDNNLHAIEARAVFQFYPMVNLWHDVQLALTAGLDMVHLTAEPISVAELSQGGFGRQFENTLNATPAKYDFRSRHAALFGVEAPYQYSKRETLLAVRAFAQSEPRAPKGAHGAA
jgi:nucleoside-diphosphate-sugar epimerase